MGLILTIISLCLVATAAYAEVGKVTALMGTALIHDGAKSSDAKPGELVGVKYGVKTDGSSKIKILFTDGTILTLNEATKISVDNYTYEEEEEGGGNLSLTLISGGMRLTNERSEIGISTETALISTRGSATVEIESGRDDGDSFVTIICMRGDARVKSSDASIEDTALVRAGYMVTVWKNEPPLDPIPAPTEVLGGEGKPPAVKKTKETADSGFAKNMTFSPVPPSVDRQTAPSAPVTINITFPPDK